MSRSSLTASSRRAKSPGSIDPCRRLLGGVVVAAFAARFPHLVDKIILASFGIRVNEKLVQAIKEGQRLNGSATGEQVAGVIIKYFGQHLNESFKRKMYDQFKNITKEHLENFFHAHGELLQSTSILMKSSNFIASEPKPSSSMAPWIPSWI